MKLRNLASTRVSQALLEGGPQTAATLGKVLGMTATAARKHLDVLEASGLVSHHEQAPFGPRSTGPRGRGRPAKVFALTPAGREFFAQSYDDIAVEAVTFIGQQLGPEGIKRFAQQRVASVFQTISASNDVTAESLAQGLSDAGFSASLRPAPVVDAVQLCQHTCPISHVASEFPQFCDAETDAISSALGVHVTRLSTIATGSEICTTHIPLKSTSRSS